MEIYDELEYAENLIKNGFRYDMSLFDLTVLGKYYIEKEFPVDGIRSMLVKFCQKHRQGFNEVIFGSRLDKAVASAKKKPLRVPHPIFIYKSEVEKIRVLKNHRLEKILFVMLCFGKYNYQYRENIADGQSIKEAYYVNRTFSSILKESKVYAPKKEQNEIKMKIHDLGFVDSSGGPTENDKEDSYKVLFAEKEGEIFAKIDRPSEILNYYPLYCLECRREITKKGKRKEYCSECWKNIDKNQTRERVRKHRKNTV